MKECSGSVLCEHKNGRHWHSKECIGMLSSKDGRITVFDLLTDSE